MAVDVGTKKQGGCPPPPPPKAFRPHPRPERPFPPPPPPPPFMPGPCCPPTNTLVLNNTIIKSVDNALKITEGYVHGSPAYFIEFDGDLIKPTIVGEDPIEVKEGVFTEEDGSEHNGFLVTIKDMVGAAADKDGKAGTVPAPKAGDQTKFLRADGTWATITIPEVKVMTGATETDDGETGTVPTPVAGDQDKYLSGDATWKDLPEQPSDFTGATAQDAGEHGLVPAPVAGDQDKYLSGAGTWNSLPAQPTVFVGATSIDNGTSGLVPQPLISNRTQFLCGNGNWTDILQLPVSTSQDEGKILTVNSSGTAVWDTAAAPSSNSWKEWSISNGSSGHSTSVYLGSNTTLPNVRSSIAVGHYNSVIGSTDISVFGSHNTLSNSNQDCVVSGRYNTVTSLLDGVIYGCNNRYSSKSSSTADQVAIFGYANTGIGTDSSGNIRSANAYQSTIMGILNKTEDVDLTASVGYNNTVTHVRQCAVFGYSNDVTIYDYSGEAKTTENIVVGTYATVRGYKNAILSCYGTIVGDYNAIVSVYGNVGAANKTGSTGNASRNLGILGTSGSISVGSNDNMALCQYHTVTGSYNRVMAASGHTTGDYNINLGYGNELDCNNSITLGKQNITSAQRSILLGYSNSSANGSQSGVQINIGCNNTVEYGNGISIGSNNRVNSGCLALGSDNIAEYGAYLIGHDIRRGNTSGEHFAFGSNLLTNYQQVVVGYFNEEIGGYGANVAFIVGSGSDAANRKNALVVYKDGTVHAKHFVSDDPDMTLVAGQGINLDPNLSEETITISSKIPEPPTTDGVYTLTCTVDGGVASYSWT